MRIDPTLPHYPYAVSVAEALAETEHAPVLDQVRAEFGSPPERLQARLTRRKHAVLIWQPQLGWRHATTQGQFEAPETAPRLTTATVPAPAVSSPGCCPDRALGASFSRTWFTP